MVEDIKNQISKVKEEINQLIFSKDNISNELDFKSSIIVNQYITPLLSKEMKLKTQISFKQIKCYVGNETGNLFYFVLDDNGILEYANTSLSTWEVTPEHFIIMGNVLKEVKEAGPKIREDIKEYVVEEIEDLNQYKNKIIEKKELISELTNQVKLKTISNFKKDLLSQKRLIFNRNERSFKIIKTQNTSYHITSIKLNRISKSGKTCWIECEDSYNTKWEFEIGFDRLFIDTPKFNYVDHNMSFPQYNLEKI